MYTQNLLCSYGDTARGCLEAVAVAGDCGAVQINSTAHTAARAIGKIPCYRHGKEHIAAPIHGTAPYRTPEQIVNGNRYGYHIVGLIVAQIEVGSSGGRIGVGIYIVDFRRERFRHIEVDGLFGRVAGGIPYTEGEAVSTGLQIVHRVVHHASGAAVRRRRIVIGNSCKGLVAVENRNHLVAHTGIGHIYALVVADGGYKHWRFVYKISVAEVFVIQHKALDGRSYCIGHLRFVESIGIEAVAKTGSLGIVVSVVGIQRKSGRAEILRNFLGHSDIEGKAAVLHDCRTGENTFAMCLIGRFHAIASVGTGGNRIFRIENIGKEHAVETGEHITGRRGYRTCKLAFAESLERRLGVVGDRYAVYGIYANQIGWHGKRQRRIAYKNIAQTVLVGIRTG